MTNPLLDSIIGHEPIIAQLKGLLENRSVPHGMLFYGPAGVGKRTIARALAASLLSGSDSEMPENTRLLLHGSHPDFHIVSRETGKKDLNVEAIRGLCGTLQLKPYYARAAVGVIDNAHQMNLAASNALLMTLEEPQPERYLMLITDSPQRLPATIISRCQLFHFGELGQPAVEQILRRNFSDYIEEPLLNSILSTFQPSTFGPLLLDDYLDPKTLLPTERKPLINHLEHLIAERRRIEGPLRRFFNEQQGEGDIAAAVALATSLSEDKDSLPLVWELLRTEARRSLRTATGPKLHQRATALLNVLETEELAHERTLNTPLALSTLLTQIAETQI